MLDPTAEDEDQCNGSTTLVLNDDGQICTIRKPGGKIIAQNIIENFLSLSQKRVKMVNSIIEKSLRENKT